MTSVNINPERAPFWIIDERIDDPVDNGHSQLDQGQERLTPIVYQKVLLFQACGWTRGTLSKS